MLLELFQGYQTISIVGMAKNAGKTVTLNAILDEADISQQCIGLTSIGRDGERQDIVTRTDKPMIYAYEGTIIATSNALFEASEAKLEVLEITDFLTSLGKIVIGKVISPGYVQIAGACSNKDIKLTCEKMKQYGASLVIVDGAIDRKSTASPSITEATLLSTGAVLSRDMQKAIEKTVYQVELFNLKTFEDTSIRAIAEQAIRCKQIMLLHGGEHEVLDIQTALNAGNKIGAVLKEETQYIVLPGSLVTKTVLDIVKTSRYYKSVTLIVRDATRIFIDYKDWIYFKKIGIKICVLDEIKLRGVSINPTSPEGYFYDPKTYQAQLEFYLKGLPVIDVMA